LASASVLHGGKEKQPRRVHGIDAGLASLFFSADHQHYGWYLPLYYQQLAELQTSYHSTQELLRANCFSVSRSNVPSSRNPVYLTIEQTINRRNRSAKTAGGVDGVSLKPSTYQRWGVTRHTRATYLQATLERAGITSEHKSSPVKLVSVMFLLRSINSRTPLQWTQTTVTKYFVLRLVYLHQRRLKQTC